MKKNIDPSLVKIGTYLQLEEDCFFNIPEYQRAYSWRIENCDKLWQDITDFLDGDRNDRYFFGTIIINCQDGDTQLDLIDGQQRTTTFLLLLKALLIRVNSAILKTKDDEDSESLCRGLKARRRKLIEILYKADIEDIPDIPERSIDSDLCKKDSVLVNNSINEKFSSELQTILYAVDFEEAERDVVRIPYKQKDNKYTNFFRNFKFFYGRACDLSDSQLNTFTKTLVTECEVIEIRSWEVSQAITMFNSLNSDGLPLFDSDIISAKLYAEAENQGCSDLFKAKWKELNELIEELDKKGIASIDSILMQQMYCERMKRREVLSETNAVIVTTPGVRRYFTEINKELLKDPIGLCESMINLSRIWVQISSYPAVQLLFKFNENSKLFLANYFKRFKAEDVTQDSVLTILQCMLRLFTILELVDTGYSSSSFKSFLFGEGVKLVDPNISIDIIKQDFDKHICSKWTKDEIKDRLLDYDGNILVYLNEYLFALEHDMGFSLESKYDIEHIMPSSGNNLQVIRRDAGIKSAEEFQNIVNKLGNKILLEIKINRSIGNEWFRTKVSSRLIEKNGYIDSHYPLAQNLVSTYGSSSKPHWVKEDILKATEKASARICNFIFG